MARVPSLRLLVLTGMVAAAHLALLGAFPRVMQVPGSTSAKALLTRTIAPPAPPPVAAAEPMAIPVAAVTPVVRTALVERAAPSTPVRTKPLPVPPTQPDEPALPAAAVPLALATPATAPQPPPAAFHVAPSARLRYQVTAQAKGISLNGEGELQWRHDGNNYEAQLQVSAPLLPKRTQRSTGRITPQGLEPLRFSDKSRNEEAAHFERDQGKVSFSSNKPDAPLLAGAQDRLSVMLQLGAMIAGEPKKFPHGTQIPIQTASTREAEPWIFVVEGAEPLQLPGGQVNTLKLTRSPRKEFDQKVELWLAPGMDYVPVRLRLTQPNGDWVDQQWSSTDRS